MEHTFFQPSSRCSESLLDVNHFLTVCFFTFLESVLDSFLIFLDALDSFLVSFDFVDSFFFANGASLPFLEELDAAGVTSASSFGSPTSLFCESSKKPVSESNLSTRSRIASSVGLS